MKLLNTSNHDYYKKILASFIILFSILSVCLKAQTNPKPFKIDQKTLSYIESIDTALSNSVLKFENQINQSLFKTIVRLEEHSDSIEKSQLKSAIEITKNTLVMKEYIYTWVSAILVFFTLIVTIIIGFGIVIHIRNVATIKKETEETVTKEQDLRRKLDLANKLLSESEKKLIELDNKIKAGKYSIGVFGKEIEVSTKNEIELHQKNALTTLENVKQEILDKENEIVKKEKEIIKKEKEIKNLEKQLKNREDKLYSDISIIDTKNRIAFNSLHNDLLQFGMEIIEDFELEKNKKSLAGTYREILYEHQSILKLYSIDLSSIIKTISSIKEIGTKRAIPHLKYFLTRFETEKDWEGNEDIENQKKRAKLQAYAAIDRIEERNSNLKNLNGYA